jgi:hypothetical protein
VDDFTPVRDELSLLATANAAHVAAEQLAAVNLDVCVIRDQQAAAATVGDRPVV